MLKLSLCFLKGINLVYLYIIKEDFLMLKLDQYEIYLAILSGLRGVYAGDGLYLNIEELAFVFQDFEDADDIAALKGDYFVVRGSYGRLKNFQKDFEMMFRADDSFEYIRGKVEELIYNNMDVEGVKNDE